MLVLWSDAAMAGKILEVGGSADQPTFTEVGHTKGEADDIVNWEGRPLQLVVVADMSVSVILDPSGPGAETRSAMEAACKAMEATPVPGDEFGVIVFAANAIPWVPLGPPSRPGMDRWLDSFGASHKAPPPWATAQGLRPGQWNAEPVRPEDLGVDVFATDPGAGLRSALISLRPGGADPLKAVVVIWDGEATVPYALGPLLNRLWKNEIHVFTIAVGKVHPEGLDARGGGDVYLSGGHAAWAMEHIVGELKMPPAPEPAPTER